MWINRNARSGHFHCPSVYGYRLAIGYFRVVKGGEENYRRFPSQFGSHGMPLCFWNTLGGVVFILVGRPVGKAAASIPLGATQTPGYVRSLKLVWFGDFKMQFWILCFGIPGAPV